MKHSRSALHIILPALIVLAGAAWAVRHHTHPRQLPSEECSEIFRDYADNQHVAVAFIKDFYINNTQTVNVTTLHALDSIGWQNLMHYFGFPQEMIDFYYENREQFDDNENSTLIKFCVDVNDLKKRLPSTLPDSRQVIGSYKEKTFTVYQTNNIKTKQTINIQTIKNLKK